MVQSAALSLTCRWRHTDTNQQPELHSLNPQRPPPTATHSSDRPGGRGGVRVLNERIIQVKLLQRNTSSSVWFVFQESQRRRTIRGGEPPEEHQSCEFTDSPSSLCGSSDSNVTFSCVLIKRTQTLGWAGSALHQAPAG